MRKNKTGFTLIELLVVITIIGILATGATAVYTSQIQKARDTTRINDVKALQSGIEQYYQDDSEYPDATEFQAGVQAYVPKLPQDSKNGQPCNNGGTSTDTYCDYVYVVGDDLNGITYGSYEVSTAFENATNTSKKGGEDGGGDNLRLELGLQINEDVIGGNSTTLGSDSSGTLGAVSTTSTTIIIRENGVFETP